MAAPPLVSAVTSMRNCVVWSKASPLARTFTLPTALPHSASEAATVAGSVVNTVEAGWVSGTTFTMRTLVSPPVPVFCTVTPRVAVSQLSRKPSSSPPVTVTATAGSRPRLPPATGTVVAVLLMRPTQAAVAPTGITLKW